VPSGEEIQQSLRGFVATWADYLELVQRLTERNREIVQGGRAYAPFA
jgi:hypothetical protein